MVLIPISWSRWFETRPYGMGIRDVTKAKWYESETGEPQ